MTSCKPTVKNEMSLPGLSTIEKWFQTQIDVSTAARLDRDTTGERPITTPINERVLRWSDES